MRERSIPFIIVTDDGKQGLTAAVAGVPVVEKPFYVPRLLEVLMRLFEPQ